MSEASLQKPYYNALDTLRLAAMVSILFYHYSPHIFSGGFIGVDVLFVISGFLMVPGILGRAEEPLGSYYRSYLSKRIIRLGIPMLSVIVIAVAIFNICFKSLLYNVRSIFLSSIFFVNNWWQISQGMSYFEEYVHPSAFTHLWYVAVLMQLGIVWPLLIRLLNKVLKDRAKMSLVFMGMAIVSALLMAIIYKQGVDPSRVYYGTDTRLYALALGTALGLIWQPEKIVEYLNYKARLMADGIAVIAIAILVFLGNIIKDQSAFTYRGGMFISAFVAMILVMALSVPGGPINKVLSLKPFVFLGKCTYGTYLWYYPVLATGMTNEFMGNHRWLQWSILAVLSILTYLFIEQRFTKWVSDTKVPHRGQIAAFVNSIKGNKIRIGVSILTGLLALSCVIGFVRAESGDNQSQTELEQQIAENEKILKEKEAIEEREKSSDIEDIDWLDRSVMLYCHDLKVTLYGDSILLAAADPASQAFPSGNIDAEVGRQFYKSLKDIKGKVKKGKIDDVVVLVLGTNGPFTDKQFDEMMSLLEDKKIFLVNTSVPRSWKGEVNKKLKKEADKDKKDNIYLIDWKSLADEHPKWFYQDKTHTTPEGAEGYIKLIADTLYDTLASDEQKEKDRIATEAEKKKEDQKSEKDGGKDNKSKSDSDKK